jgi:hypothetical protein
MGQCASAAAAMWFQHAASVGHCSVCMILSTLPGSSTAASACVDSKLSCLVQAVAVLLLAGGLYLAGCCSMLIGLYACHGVYSICICRT